MIVTVVAVHVVQMAGHEVIDVIAMRDGRVATTRAVLMVVIVVNVHEKAPVQNWNQWLN